MYEETMTLHYNDEDYDDEDYDDEDDFNNDYDSED